MSTIWKQIGNAADRWLFTGCQPVMCSVIRIAYASVLLVYLAMWWREAERWFSNAGVLQTDTIQRIQGGEFFSLLFWLPNDPGTVSICLGLFFFQAILLWLGCWSRFQVACIFMWLVSFQNRNPFICDGQDVLMRLLAFYMIFMPLDHAWSLGGWLRGKLSRPLTRSIPPAATLSAATSTAVASAWGLRLVQLQVTAIYLSTAWEKAQGEVWRDGTALFYVARMDDLYGRFELPNVLFETPWLLAAMTWGVLLTEGLLPLLLWFPATRLVGVLVGAMLHLSIEATMHIYLFEWLMLVSLLSFVEPRWLGLHQRTVTKPPPIRATGAISHISGR